MATVLTDRRAAILAAARDAIAAGADPSNVEAFAVIVAARLGYSEDQSRAEDGKFGEGGGSSSSSGGGFAAPGSGSYALAPGQPAGTWAVSVGDGKRKKLLKLACAVGAGGPQEPSPSRGQQLGQACASDAEALAILSSLADLYRMFPTNPPVSAEIVTAQAAARAHNAGAMAFTNLATNRISIVAGTVAVSDSADRATNGLGNAVRDVGIRSYVIAHEYGHALQPDGGEVAALHRALLDLPDAGGLSPYGQTNSAEGYAEAFADFTCTGGRSGAVATQAYAREFAWIGLGA